MKIALAQMEVVPGQPRKNIKTLLRMIGEAKAAGVHLLAFPELCLSGYLVGDKFLEDRFCADLMEYDDILRKASEGIALAYGNLFVHQGQEGFHPNKDGRSRKYNAVRLFQNGKPIPRAKDAGILPLGVQSKTLLPNYRFFDDERYFFSLEDVAKDFNVSLEELLQPYLIDVNGEPVSVGFAVCEDLWCEDYRRKGRAQNITKMLIENGAQYIINISASPWTFGKHHARDNRLKFLKQESGDAFVPFFYVNCTGAQNNGKNIITFDGGSTVYNRQGQPIFLAEKPYQEELLVMDTKDADGPAVSRTEKPYIAQKLEAIIEGLRHLKHIRGREEHQRFVIGLSGGVDSSVVAAILTLAFGRDKVLGVNMPTRFNSDKTKDAARSVAEQLGIAYLEIPIEELATANEQLLERYTPDGEPHPLNALQKGNIAAKIRGANLLSNIVAQYGALFTNNGNKLETALGYATLYGDVNGAVAPLADLLKTEIFDLARYLNAEVFKREVIPAAVIPDELFRFTKGQIPPSAELEEEQVDPMKFGYHDALLAMMTDYRKKTPEDFLRWFKEGTLHQHVAEALQKSPWWGQQIMRRWNVDAPQAFIEDMEWFVPLIQQSVFKRVQAPPIIITSKSAYGYDIRESLLPWQPTGAYEQLKAEVLALSSYKPAYQPEEVSVCR